MKPTPMRLMIMLFVLIFFWGASWPVNKFALAYTPPILYAGVRTFLGGVLVALVFLKSWKKIQFRTYWKQYMVVGIINTALYFGIQTVGLQYLPSGLFSVIVFFYPILLGFLSWSLLGERLSRLQFVGLFMGFIGIAIASIDGLTTHVSVLGVGLALLTACSWTAGVIYVKRIDQAIDPFWLVAFQNIFGGLLLLLVGSLTESWRAIELAPGYLFGLSYGATIGVPIAYLMYYYLIQKIGANKVAATTFLIPIVAVLLSVAFLDEVITPKLLIGLFFVGISIYLVNAKGVAEEKIKPSTAIE